MTTTVSLEAPYLIFLGDCPDLMHAKTGAGIVEWRRDKCVGQMKFDE